METIIKYPKFIIYIDKKGEYRWRLVTRNGRIMADSGEGYVSKGNCKKAVMRLHSLLVPSLQIVDKTNGR